ncbi:MAG: hypothetical protein GF390_02720 [Candidatus Pacebacteria bacterium]|nr:hypothetical protein [Candidatus Paceibacterota bacterium]
MPIVVFIIQIFLLFLLATLFLKVLGGEKPQNNLHLLFVILAKFLGVWFIFLAALRIVIGLLQLLTLI